MTNAEQRVKAVEARVASWFEDKDTWVGVFVNHDLGHCDCGMKCAFPFALASFDAAEIGKTRAPDGKTIGLGWRYLLEAKCQTVEEVKAAFPDLFKV